MCLNQGDCTSPHHHNKTEAELLCGQWRKAHDSNNNCCHKSHLKSSYDIVDVPAQSKSIFYTN